MSSNSLLGLFRSYRAEILAYLTGKLRDPELAADLTQEAFLRYAERAPAEVATIRNNRSYLYRTAHNLAIDHIRRSARNRVETPGDVVIGRYASDLPGQEQQTADRQAVRRLHAILAELPERTRRAFILNRVEGMNYNQVALRLGISESSVQKHLARALIHTTRRLRDADGNGDGFE